MLFLKKRGFFLGLSILLFMNSCTADRNIFMGGAKMVISEPVKACPIEGSIISFDGLPLYAAPHMVNDTSLVIFSYGFDNVLVYKGNLNSHELSPILLKGRGPDEMLIAGFVDLQTSADGHTLLRAYDINSAEMYTIDVEASEIKGSGVVRETSPLPRGVFRLFLDKDRLVAKIHNPKERSLDYEVMSSDLEIVRQYAIYGQTNLSNYQVVASADCMRPDGSMVFLGMNYFDKANFLSLDSDDHFTVVTDKKWKYSYDLDLFQKVQESGTFQDLEQFYLQSQCTQDIVFSLRYPGDQMRVFNWDGSIRAEYVLDRQLTAFDCSGDGNTIIGVTQEGVIVKYSLPRRK